MCPTLRLVRLGRGKSNKCFLDYVCCLITHALHIQLLNCKCMTCANVKLRLRWRNLGTNQIIVTIMIVMTLLLQDHNITTQIFAVPLAIPLNIMSTMLAIHRHLHVSVLTLLMEQFLFSTRTPKKHITIGPLVVGNVVYGDSKLSTSF